MTPTYTLHSGDCLEVMRAMPDNSVDSIVTDPPYGLAFMGKRWDHDVPSEDIWREALRVLKPGGHLLSFFGTRTYHRGVVRIEDAGFDIRDQIGWMYGSGFPKSLDVSKAIDKAAGAEREVIGVSQHSAKRVAATLATGNENPSGYNATSEGERLITAPATPEAQAWAGWGTALKPAFEPIVVARKPLIGTVSQNVLTHGTGALNIDDCRIGDGEGRASGGQSGSTAIWSADSGQVRTPRPTGGRWPANFIHDGSDEVLSLFPESKGQQSTVKASDVKAVREVYGQSAFAKTAPGAKRGDSGSAARFFYCAKASKADRGEGNTHPTVKPTALMQYLCRLVTPPGGVVLDPFMGSGSTGKAALLEGFSFIGADLDPEHVRISRARIEAALLAAAAPANAALKTEPLFAS